MPTPPWGSEERSRKLVRASLTYLIYLCMEQGSGAGRTLPANVTQTQLCSTENLCFLSQGEKLYGGRVRAQGSVVWCVKHWEEPVSNPAQTWASPNQATKDPRGPKHSVCIRGKV